MAEDDIAQLASGLTLEEDDIENILRQEHARAQENASLICGAAQDREATLKSMSRLRTSRTPSLDILRTLLSAGLRSPSPLCPGSALAERIAELKAEGDPTHAQLGPDFLQARLRQAKEEGWNDK